MIEWYKKVVFENYANFEGRARRSEYWYFFLAQSLVIILLMVIGLIITVVFQSMAGMGVFWVLYILYVLATLVPTIAVSVRRLHDTGKSGWLYLVQLLPVLNIWFLVLMCTDGDYHTNEYGQDPKNPIDELDEIGTEFKY